MPSPARVEADAALAATDRADGQLHPILYVEDNPASLKLIEDALGFHTNLQLLTAVDGPQGIALAINRQPDLILMDSICRACPATRRKKCWRRNARTAYIPVIVLTANAMRSEIRSGVEAGFFRYLTKPIDLDVHDAAISDALGRPAG